MEQRTKGDEAAITTRTVTLQCIQPEQAIALASPFLRSNEAVVYSVPGIPAVIVRGKPEEFAAPLAQSSSSTSRVSFRRNDTTRAYFPRQTRKGLSGVPFHQSFMLSDRAMAK
jgi:hypothetical protein